MAKYKTYGNSKRDIPELNRVLHTVLNATADIPASEVVKRLPDGIKFSPRTLQNLRNGKTIYPTLRTAYLIATAFGRQLSFTPTEDLPPFKKRRR